MEPTRREAETVEWWCQDYRDGREFRWPNEEPFWRCTVNHRHRQPLVRSHLRLPKMRELIPPKDLKKLDKRFDLRDQPQLKLA